MSVLLESKDVCKYFGGLKAVEKVSMQVNRGDVFGIIGPNGAGKTTFFNICSGIYGPTSGQILLDGEDISGKSPDDIAGRGMARTFQNIQLFKFMTVLDNVKIGFHLSTKTNMLDAMLHTRRYRADEKYIREAGMAVLQKVGLEEYANVPAGNLPYGVQRKVEIGRALALDPKVILLDEPAAGMNPKETDSLREFILKLNSEGHTIVVIEHDMEFVMNSCNRILVLNFGQKICEGTPDEVRGNREVNEAYFGKGRMLKGGTGSAEG